jgi:hypothetical protein
MKFTCVVTPGTLLVGSAVWLVNDNAFTVPAGVRVRLKVAGQTNEPILALPFALAPKQSYRAVTSASWFGTPPCTATHVP